MEEGLDFTDLAKQMEGFNGADVVEFCKRSKRPARSRYIHEGYSLDDLMVTKDDIEETLKVFKSSVQKQDLEKLEMFMTQYGKSI
jgi:SpoVK/Ycf46/Vps4 family AAA+-type ATPase